MSDFMPPLVAEIRADASQFLETTDKVEKAVRGMADDTDKSTKAAGQNMVGNFAVGGAIAGIMSSITSSVISSMSQMASDAVVASDGVDKFKATMKFAGVDSATIDSVAASTRAYADQTVYDLTDIQSATAQLAANSVPDYDKLTMAAGNLNAIAGGNKETFKSVGMVLTQTAGSGKLVTENWNQLANAIPGASGKLQEAMVAAGAYTGNFRDAMANGEITAEEFNAAIMKVGTDPIAVEAAKSTTTFEGAIGNLQATIVGGLSDALTGMKPMLTGAMSGISEFIGSTIAGLKALPAWVEENKNWVVPIAAAVGLITLAITGMGVAMAVTAAGGLGAYLAAMFPAIVATWNFTAALLANPVTWIVIGIALLVAGIIALMMNWDIVVKFITDVWGGFVGWLKDGLDAVMKWWNDMWTTVWTTVTDIWNNIVSWFTDSVTGFVSWFSDHWGLLLSFIIGPIGLAIQWVVENWDGIVKFLSESIANIGNFFRDGFNGIATFLGTVWSNIGTGISNAWGAIIKFFQDMPGNILGFFSGIGSMLFNVGKDLIQGLFNGISSLAGSIGSFFLSILPDWIKTPFKIALGIHSPSTIFAEFGKNIGDGLVGGIDSMMGKVASSSSDMAAAVSNNFKPSVSLSDTTGYFAPNLRSGDTGNGVSSTLPNPSSSSSTATQQYITVNAETNASPLQIASTVGWQLRMMG